jgi:outer membrane protein OmpA-like peptidoglycan-associated protein
MSTNLLDLLSNAVSPDIIQGLSKAVGENDSAVRSGISALLPTLLGGLAHKASAPSGASSVLSMLTGSSVDSGLLGTMGSLLGGGQTGSLMQTGTSLLSGLFGSDKVAGLGSALASVAGMKASSAGGLASLVVPLAFSALKKFIGDKGIDAGGLASLLGGQRDHLAGKLDPRMTAAAGLGAPASLLAGLGGLLGAGGAAVTGAASHMAGAATSAASSTAKAGAAMAGAAMDRGMGAAAGVSSAATGAAAKASGGIGRWLPWLIGAAILAFFLPNLSKCGTTPVQKTATPAATAPAAPAPAPAVAAPAAPVVAAAAPAMAAAEAKWPMKVYFETGKAQTGAEGQATLKAVAAALAASATAKISITGYTDKTGNADANTELAKNRAVGVRDALKAAGVAEDRIAMKPPVFVEAGTGGNDAEARRVDVTLESR